MCGHLRAVQGCYHSWNSKLYKGLGPISPSRPVLVGNRACDKPQFFFCGDVQLQHHEKPYKKPSETWQNRTTHHDTFLESSHPRPQRCNARWGWFWPPQMTMICSKSGGNMLQPGTPQLSSQAVEYSVFLSNCEHVFLHGWGKHIETPCSFFLDRHVCFSCFSVFAYKASGIGMAIFFQPSVFRNPFTIPRFTYSQGHAGGILHLDLLFFVL